MSAASDRRAATEQDDELYWLRLSPAARIALTWELSRELYCLAARNGGVFDEETGTFAVVEPSDLERRLPRADLVLTRR